MRFFNTAGPVDCQRHYCLDPLKRFDLEEVLMFIDQQKYFVLHAPRQTGKTTCLLALMAHLNAGGRYRCVYSNVEPAQAARENVDAAMQAILSSIAGDLAFYLGDDSLTRRFNELLKEHGGYSALEKLLYEWTENASGPTVLLLDEVDALVGDTLISLLRQLRSGYAKRPKGFPQSIILCGVRDVRDYRIHSSAEKSVITGGSAFNIKTESLRLGDFTESEVAILLDQHTTETGQTIESDAADLIWDFTRGQPWLVNALAYEACFGMKANRDRTVTITAEIVHQAKENLIQRRDTHLDQLADKLREDRVRRVIGPVLSGQSLDRTVSDEDIQYVTDLGLVHRGSEGPQLANPIYREIVPRQLAYITQLNLESQIKREWYITPDGRLDMDTLLAAFQDFFREHSEHWVERFDYREAGPQLLMQAFLQRIVNSGGRIEREYGLGRGRTDLLLVWPHPAGVQKVVVELKVLHKSLEKTVAEGLKQTAAYMDRCGTADGHLVVFDRGEGKGWEEKIFRRTETFEGQEILVWGM